MRSASQNEMIEIFALMLEQYLRGNQQWDGVRKWLPFGCSFLYIHRTLSRQGQQSSHGLISSLWGCRYPFSRFLFRYASLYTDGCSKDCRGRGVATRGPHLGSQGGRGSLAKSAAGHHRNYVLDSLEGKVNCRRGFRLSTLSMQRRSRRKTVSASVSRSLVRFIIRFGKALLDRLLPTGQLHIRGTITVQENSESKSELAPLACATRNCFPLPFHTLLVLFPWNLPFGAPRLSLMKLHLFQHLPFSSTYRCQSQKGGEGFAHCHLEILHWARRRIGHQHLAKQGWCEVRHGPTGRRISLPLIGDISVTGLSPDELSDRLLDNLKHLSFDLKGSC